MKILFFLIILILSACKPTTNQTTHDTDTVIEIRDTSQTIGAILDSANVTGSILIYNPETNTYTSNDFGRAQKGFLPASTFKIPNSIIALELGNAASDSTILPWDGVIRTTENWNRNLTLAEAYKYSCVPCYQALARKAGVENMETLLDKIEYPGIIFDSSNLDLFWLQGESKISQMTQISFLQKLKNRRLPLRQETYRAMKKIMVYDQTEDYTIYAKTGLAIRDSVSYGWFVGYMETKEKTYYFATNIAPGNGMDLWGEFVPLRAKLTLEAVRLLL